MNKSIASTLIVAVLFLITAITSCSSKKEAHDHDSSGHQHDADGNHMNSGDNDSETLSFKNAQMEAAFGQYSMLRKALTDTDFENAKSSALSLLEAIKKVEDNEALVVATESISNATEIEAQRLAFSNLSDRMLARIKGNLASGELYMAHCPMALDNTGANWITEVNEIRNPYFGDKMMKCGVIKETLN